LLLLLLNDEVGDNDETVLLRPNGTAEPDDDGDGDGDGDRQGVKSLRGGVSLSCAGCVDGVTGEEEGVCCS
jgi:hypothetical protein